MIDLNLKPKAQQERWEPEEIACAIIAVTIWTALAFLIGGAL